MAVSVDDVKKVEAAHKQLFVQLVQANAFLLGLQELLDQKKINASVVATYYNALAKAVQHWQQNQTELEKYGVPKMHPIWFSKANLPAMVQMAQAVQQSIGLSGLGVFDATEAFKWIATALAPVLSIALITDILTDTAQEKAQMVTDSAIACKNAGLTPEQCTSVLNNQIDSTKTEGFWSILKWPAIAAAGFFIIKESGILKSRPA